MKETILKIILLVSVFVVAMAIFGEFVGPYDDGQTFFSALATTYIFYYVYLGTTKPKQ